MGVRQPIKNNGLQLPAFFTQISLHQPTRGSTLLAVLVEIRGT